MKTLSPDTDPKAEEVWINLIKKQTPAQRLAQARSLSATVIKLSKRAIRRANKDLNDMEVNLLFIEYHYGKDLAKRVREYLEKREHEKH